MAEEESEFELEGLMKQLESLLDLNSGEEHALQSKSYCARFCKVRADEVLVVRPGK